MSAWRSEKVSTRSGSSARIFGHVGGNEGADARLLASHPRGAHGIARDPDDAGFLAEEIQRLDRLLGEADDAGGTGITCHRPPSFGHATATGKWRPARFAL